MAASGLGDELVVSSKHQFSQSGEAFCAERAADMWERESSGVEGRGFVALALQGECVLLVFVGGEFVYGVL